MARGLLALPLKSVRSQSVIARHSASGPSPCEAGEEHRDQSGQRIGFVSQHHHLISAFTAEENVAMPQLVARGWPDAAMFARAGELLARVGLAERRRQLAKRLSGGQQQRVAIARALMMAPALVLADEPTGNLDTHSADEVFALLREVNVQLGTSFLIVTHDLRLAQRCDRIIKLIDGTIVADRPNPLR